MPDFIAEAVRRRLRCIPRHHPRHRRGVHRRDRDESLRYPGPSRLHGQHHDRVRRRDHLGGGGPGSRHLRAPRDGRPARRPGSSTRIPARVFYAPVAVTPWSVPTPHRVDRPRRHPEIALGPHPRTRGRDGAPAGDPLGVTSPCGSTGPPQAWTASSSSAMPRPGSASPRTGSVADPEFSQAEVQRQVIQRASD